MLHHCGPAALASSTAPLSGKRSKVIVESNKKTCCFNTVPSRRTQSRPRGCWLRSAPLSRIAAVHHQPAVLHDAVPEERLQALDLGMNDLQRGSWRTTRGCRRARSTSGRREGPAVGSAAKGVAQQRIGGKKCLAGKRCAAGVERPVAVAGLPRSRARESLRPAGATEPPNRTPANAPTGRWSTRSARPSAIRRSAARSTAKGRAARPGITSSSGRASKWTRP